MKRTRIIGRAAPKIDKLNIKIVDGSQLYAGLQSGEIDITQQTMSDIPQEDYESVEALGQRRRCIRFPGYQPVRIYPDKERSGCKSSSGDAVCDRPSADSGGTVKRTW